MVNNIQQVSDALLCSNCGACIAVCPKNAISISSTTLGRKFASVDDNCIDCGLCLNVCPSLDRQNLRAMHADKYVGEIRNVYVGKSTNREIYNNSQSGGACMSVISYLFDTGAIDAAVLCRMDYGNPPEVKSFLVESKEGLTNYQKSCYTPVDLLSALREATSKKAIAVVGLPCHIQGAESLIRYHHRFHNIRYKIGLICDRTLCAGIQNVMLSVTPPYKHPEKVKILWRDKRPRQLENVHYAYQNAPVMVVSESGQEKMLPNSYRFALKDYFTSPRCRVCYDKLNTFSDLVFGDPWGMSGVDWENGESVIMVRTKVGERVIGDMIKDHYLSLKERDVSEVITGQHVNARRVQVQRYSLALQVIPCKVDSYIYQQGRNLKDDIRHEQGEIADFMRRDTLPMDEIISESRNIINKFILRQKFNKLLFVRVLRKIKNLFR